MAFADVALTRTAELAMVCVIAFMASSCCVARVVAGSTIRRIRCDGSRLKRNGGRSYNTRANAIISSSRVAASAHARARRSMSRRARARAGGSTRVAIAVTLALGAATRGRAAAEASVEPSAPSAAASRWRELALDEDAFETVKSYDRPSYYVDAGGRARFRGWFSNTATTEAGSDALATPLPAEARPTRDEPWKVTMKGAERSLTVTMDGKIVVGDEYDANTWFVLNGLEFDTAAAFAEEETCDAASGSCPTARDEL